MDFWGAKELSNSCMESKKIKKSAQFDDIVNTPSFHTAPRWFYYWAFALTYEALEAYHIPHEEIIILPDMMQYQRENDSEFIAEENQLWGSEGAQKHILSTSQVNMFN